MHLFLPRRAFAGLGIDRDSGWCAHQRKSNSRNSCCWRELGIKHLLARHKSNPGRGRMSGRFPKSKPHAWVKRQLCFPVSAARRWRFGPGLMTQTSKTRRAWSRHHRSPSRHTHFKFLKNIAIGDEIFITNTAGDRMRFAITETRIVSAHHSGLYVEGAKGSNRACDVLAIRLLFSEAMIVL